MKLKSEIFYYHSEDGTKVTYTSEISVDVNGLFQFSILPEFKDVFEIVKSSKPEFAIIQVTIDRKKRTPVIVSTVKETGVSFMKKLIAEFYKCEATEEYVIRYIFHNRTSAVKDKFGRFYGNGAIMPNIIKKESDDEYQWTWVGDSNIHAAATTDFYYVGLNAGLYRKQTFKRGDKITIKYIHVTTSCRGQVEHERDIVFTSDTYAAKLASFMCLASRLQNSKHESEWKEVPYSENAARFFYELLISICQLGDKVMEFFNDPKSIEYISKEKTDDIGRTLHNILEYKN